MKQHLKPPKRIRDKAHMATVRERGCCICGNPVADAHHLRTVGHGRGMAIKNGDNWTIPLCRMHHDELHNFGDEKTFLDLHGIDAAQLAINLWRITNEEKGKEEEGIPDSEGSGNGRNTDPIRDA